MRRLARSSAVRHFRRHAESISWDAHRDNCPAGHGTRPGGLIAIVFVTLGLGLGSRLVGRTDPAPSAMGPASHEAPRDASRPPAEPAPNAPRITKREQEILALIAAGLTNKEIADRLFVSENTVKTHSSRLFEKLSGAAKSPDRVTVWVGIRLSLAPTSNPRSAL